MIYTDYSHGCKCVQTFKLVVSDVFYWLDYGTVVLLATTLLVYAALGTEFMSMGPESKGVAALGLTGINLSDEGSRGKLLMYA